MDRNAEAIYGPLFVFTGTRYRYFENTSITYRMYLCILLYISRDCTSNRSHSHTSIGFVTVYGLRKNRPLTGLCCVNSSSYSSHSLNSDLFFLGIAAASFSKVEEADSLAGL